MCGVRSFTAREGHIHLPSALLSHTGEGSAVVRSVALAEASAVVCAPATESHVNFVRHNMCEVAAALRAARACCQEREKVRFLLCDLLRLSIYAMELSNLHFHL